MFKKKTDPNIHHLSISFNGQQLGVTIDRSNKAPPKDSNVDVRVYNDLYNSIQRAADCNGKREELRPEFEHARNVTMCVMFSFTWICLIGIPVLFHYSQKQQDVAARYVDAVISYLRDTVFPEVERKYPNYTFIAVDKGAAAAYKVTITRTGSPPPPSQDIVTTIQSQPNMIVSQQPTQLQMHMQMQPTMQQQQPMQPMMQQPMQPYNNVMMQQQQQPMQQPMYAQPYQYASGGVSLAMAQPQNPMVLQQQQSEVEKKGEGEGEKLTSEGDNKVTKESS